MVDVYRLVYVREVPELNKQKEFGLRPKNLQKTISSDSQSEGGLFLNKRRSSSLMAHLKTQCCLALLLTHALFKYKYS